ncbi:pentapeptide repeat-containing protein [Streptomyces sp. NPDC020719]|uniref:pentapeptide repeat-containing protein n=1 Tax=Streptomyces sp. NPDC020719 TaxID=3154896 RepID=UPI0033F9BE2A
MTLLTGVGAAVVAAGLLFVLLGPVAHRLTRSLPVDSTPPKERHDALTANRDLLLKSLTGLLALGALAYTAQTFRVAQQQAATAVQGQVTDRYTKAIEELDADGPGKEDIRIGAMYALERLMGDSPRDHNTVVDVLASFVRHHDKAAGDSAAPSDEALGPGDVQAALTVLGRRDRRGETHRLDLRDIGVAHMDLEQADLYHADLFQADLQKARLAKADLRTASLVAARLQGARLPGADLRRAHLDGADLTGADLARADLRGTDFTAAHSPDADPQPAAKGLTCAQLRTAITDGTTRLPPALSC